MKAKEFLVRQKNGIVRGKITLTEEGTKKYNEANYIEQTEMRIGLSSDVSIRFKTDCYVSEVL